MGNSSSRAIAEQQPVQHTTQAYTKFVRPAIESELLSVDTGEFDQTFAGFAASHFEPLVQHHLKQRTRSEHDLDGACHCLLKCEVDMDTTTDKGPLEHGRYDTIQRYTHGPRSYVLHLPILAQAAEAQKGSIAEDSNSNSNSNDAGDADMPSLSDSKPLPVVILLHGTDETAFDTEWMLQGEGTMAWLELSHAERFAVILPQARGAVTKDDTWKSNWRDMNDPLRTMWLISCFDPAESDHHFFHTCLHDASDQATRRGCALDFSRVFLAGYSNGGFMAGDVLLRRVSVPTDHPDETTSSPLSDVAGSAASGFSAHAPYPFPYKQGSDNFPLAGVCLFMGAIDDSQLTVATGLIEKDLSISPALEACLSLHNNKGGGEVLPPGVEYVQTHDNVKQHRVEFLPSASAVAQRRTNHVVPSLIYSGTRDPQMLSSIRAFRAMSTLNQPTEFRLVDGGQHMVKPGAVREIWEYFTHQKSVNP